MNVYRFPETVEQARKVERFERVRLIQVLIDFFDCDLAGEILCLFGVETFGEVALILQENENITLHELSETLIEQNQDKVDYELDSSFLMRDEDDFYNQRIGERLNQVVSNFDSLAKYFLTYMENEDFITDWKNYYK